MWLGLWNTKCDVSRVRLSGLLSNADRLHGEESGDTTGFVWHASLSLSPVLTTAHIFVHSCSSWTDSSKIPNSSWPLPETQGWCMCHWKHIFSIFWNWSHCAHWNTSFSSFWISAINIWIFPLQDMHEDWPAWYLCSAGSQHHLWKEPQLSLPCPTLASFSSCLYTTHKYSLSADLDMKCWGWSDSHSYNGTLQLPDTDGRSETISEWQWGSNVFCWLCRFYDAISELVSGLMLGINGYTHQLCKTKHCTTVRYIWTGI